MRFSDSITGRTGYASGSSDTYATIIDCFLQIVIHSIIPLSEQ